LNARSLKSLFAIASTTAILLAGCDSLPGRPTQADLPLRPSAVTDFAALYGENCAGCHGADGKSGAAVAMNNPVYLAIVDDASMRRVIADGVAGTPMPPFATSAGGSLTDPQIDILIAGIRKSWAGAPGAGTDAPPYSGSAGNPNNGSQVYAASCQSCHGADGKGGPKAGSIVNPSYLSLVSDQNLRTIVIAGRPELGHPDWRNDVAGQPLTPAQVSDVVAWLASKRPASPLAQSN
jgi:cytochrome c oxidase cbb3-type subunit 3